MGIFELLVFVVLNSLIWLLDGITLGLVGGLAWITLDVLRTHRIVACDGWGCLVPFLLVAAVYIALVSGALLVALRPVWRRRIDGVN